MARGARIALWVALAATTLTAVGCFEVKQRLVLREGAPGEFVTEIRLDLRGMAQMMVDVGEAADLELALQDLRTDFETEQMTEAPETMPAGVSWLGGSQKVEGDTAIVIFRVGFETLESLKQPVAVGLPQGAGQAMDQEPMLGPLDMTTKGKKVMISGSPQGNLAEGEDAEAMQMMIDMLPGAKMVFELHAPDWKVKKSDAHEQEGDILRWSWDLGTAVEGPEVNATFKR